MLPAFNEDANIRDAVQRATDAAERFCVERQVIVVDDGSTDRTAEVVRSMMSTDPRITLVSHEHNLGYGEALRSGFRAAQMDLVFLTDADNQFDLEEIKTFLDAIQDADVVAGYRINRQDGTVRRLFGAGWNFLVRAIFSVPVRDIDCAFKLFRREVFDEIDLESVGAMLSTELMVKLGRSGARVVERGVTHFPRTAGRARGADPRVIAKAFYELMRMYRRLGGRGSFWSRRKSRSKPAKVA